jgi:hypothetical protein
MPKDPTPEDLRAFSAAYAESDGDHASHVRRYADPIKQQLDAMSWDTLPEHVYHGLRRYFEFGVRTGAFLEAVLSNNFGDAVLRADALNVYNLRNFACFLRDQAPLGSCGSPQAYKNWTERGGLRGIAEKKP